MLRPFLLSLVSLGCCDVAFGVFRVSNTLGDGMVLQRAPSAAVVWGFGTPGASVVTTFNGASLSSKVGEDGIWRQTLSPTSATKTPRNISFKASDGGVAALHNVIFGDVFFCSGQSNMQYTPMRGMNNLSAEIAAADGYGHGIRLLTVGMDSKCANSTCSKPWVELNTTVKPLPDGGHCPGGYWVSCRSYWTPASSKTVGGWNGWDMFSAVCWLMGRDIYDGLGGNVPVGLISSNWGGTAIQKWQTTESLSDCGGAQASAGSLYNSMVAPFTVGPMALTGFAWYQGENNVGAAAYYACAFPSMITRWREKFRNEKLWFGFIQIAGYNYGPGTAAADLRQAQLSALRLRNIGMSTAIDTGDYLDIHPPDKQYPALRLANQALLQIYSKSKGYNFPLLARSVMYQDGLNITVVVSIRAGGNVVALTGDAPTSATQSSALLSKTAWVPRNKCVTAAINGTSPQDCGYPAIMGVTSKGVVMSLNATAKIGKDRSSIVLTATAPPGSGFQPQASSYGRGSWPMTLFFAKDTKLPVIPWYANFTVNDPYSPPTWNSGATLEAIAFEDWGHVAADSVTIVV